MGRARHTHTLHAYELTDSGDYDHVAQFPVEAYPPGKSGATVRQTGGGLVSEVNLIAVSDRDAAAAIDEGQSVVLERIGGGADTREAFIVTIARTYAGGARAGDLHELRLDKEDGADLSLFPDF